MKRLAQVLHLIGEFIAALLVISLPFIWFWTGHILANGWVWP